MVRVLLPLKRRKNILTEYESTFKIIKIHEITHSHILGNYYQEKIKRRNNEAVYNLFYA